MAKEKVIAPLQPPLVYRIPPYSGICTPKRGLGDGRRQGRPKTYVGMSAEEVVRQGNLRQYGLSLEQRDAMELAQVGSVQFAGSLLMA